MKKTYIKPVVKSLHIDSEGMMAATLKVKVMKYDNATVSAINTSIGIINADEISSETTVYHSRGIDSNDLWDDDDEPGL